MSVDHLDLKNASGTSTLLALLSYCLSSIAMTIMNKYVLSGHKFRLNFFLLMLQALVSVIFLRLCKSARILSYRSLNQKDVKVWFPVSLLLVAMIYTGSKSLQYLTVAMFTIFKNVTIVCIAVGEQRMFGGPITPLMWISFGLIVLSSLLGAVNDLTFSLRGYAWMLVNCSVSASYILYMRRCIAKVNFEDFDSVYFNNALAIPVMALFSVTTENWSAFFADYYGGGPLESARSALFLGILASSVFAFAISYSTAWCMRVSSSTTYSMVGALNKLPIAISGMIFFTAERNVVNIGNILSIVISFASGIIYSLAQMIKQQQARKRTLKEEKVLLSGISSASVTSSRGKVAGK